MTAELPEKPLSRKESYLAKIAGEDVTIPDEPESRTEQYLAYIAENGGGGGGGTNNFNQLTNRPKYGNTTMTGSTNIPKVPTKTSELSNDSNFVTSGDLPTVNDATLTITQNGTSKGTFTANDADDTTIALTDTTYTAGNGLNLTGTEFSADTSVLATQTDLAGKQNTLTAGTGIDITNDVISATGGGGITELTSADYNWPTDNPTGVALWLLEPGTYFAKDGVYTSRSRLFGDYQALFAIIGEFDSTHKVILDTRTPFSGTKTARLTITDTATGEPLNDANGNFLFDSSVVQTTGTSTTQIMSQKAVTDAIAASGGAAEISSADWSALWQ